MKTQHLPIYLDNMATTPTDPRVSEAMLPYITERFGNPASVDHAYGWAAKAAVEQAQQQIAQLINADPRSIVWTSGATEAINLALKGAMHHYQRQGKHLITFTTEHKAVIDTCRHLAHSGYDATILPIQADGLIDLEQLAASIRPDTILVSVLHVNNETGVVQDLVAIGQLCRQHGCLLHVDGAQTLGKAQIDVSSTPIDLLSLSAHKVYGPKGIGALYVRYQPKVQLTPQIHGGGHQHGLRAGTLATHQIVGFGQACDLAHDDIATDIERITALRDHLWQGLQDNLDGLTLNGHASQRVPHNLNFSVAGVEGETLTNALHQIALSRGSACTSATIEPSHVLTAMGISRQQANSSLRLSLGRFTTQAEIDAALSHLIDTIQSLRNLAP